MRKLQQTGFSAIETLLVLILISILGFTGYYVYHAQRNADHTLDTTQKTVTNSVPSTKSSAVDDSIQKVAYSKLPVAFKMAYVAHASSPGNKCVDANGNPVNEANEAYDPSADYITGKFVMVGECNAAAIYAFHANSWIFVEETDFEFSCSTLKQYAVPAKLVATDTTSAKCLDANNNEVNYN